MTGGQSGRDERARWMDGEREEIGRETNRVRLERRHRESWKRAGAGAEDGRRMQMFDLEAWKFPCATVWIRERLAAV